MDDHPRETPLFTFGVIADIQYADIDDGYNYSCTRRRYYRSSLQLLRNAQKSWSESAVQPEFILQLGDIIDGFNKGHDASDRALDTVLREFSSSPVEVHHVWGNHEFYNFSRSALLCSKLNSTLHTERCLSEAPSANELYAYQFSPFPGFTFVVLDAYDVSLLGREKSSEQYSDAMGVIRRYNNNEDLNCPPGHLPVHPCSTDEICLSWNFDELLAIIQSHSSVVCFMAGHDHDGGYYQDKDTGVHHLTLAGVIETPPDSNAFGTVSVYKDRMVLEGNGRITDQVFLFQSQPE
ncbi:manganese-dependent ADP-ribose/CDP-alcohol diphosphatase isoform X2 [Anoplopoma fimbria]|uniref:manganese-dependent ADP-ribose/CDP-alcohol diphosphatase isoform X2 n=1 Tax=Anoplopoma fimbria TaxID=229290 RepID=UPI0023EB39E8|nr:manganese-dependent ADP-ribose/CDP-alcohol diphosphatase isoform X2 [Anoplopoma fimbria]